MLYDAILFDLDGTAIPGVEVGMPSEALVKAAKEFKQQGHLCVATGRAWPPSKNVVKALGLIDPCILCGGALIVDPVKEQVLWQEVIDANSLKELFELTAKHGYPSGYATGLTYRRLEKGNGVSTIKNVNTFYVYGLQPDKVPEVIDNLKHIPHVNIARAYSWDLDDGIDLHITNIQATKEHAVFELCKILDVNPLNVAGVGDGFNDIHLFNADGHKVAMGNAAEELKELADEVIESLDDDGLAKFIRDVT